MFTRIVVPLDGSPEGTIAVPHACLMARVSGATVTLLRAVGHEREVADAQTFLDGLAREYGTPEVRIDGVVRQGDAGNKILDEVRQVGADLVVMRTHARAGLSRVVLGSVAQKIVSQSPSPVLLLTPSSSATAPGAITSILVPVDGSPGGSLALGTARTLAKQAGATLQLLQVVQPIPTYESSALLLNGPIDVDASWDEDAETGAQAYVEALVSRLSTRGLSIQGEAIMANSVPEAIVANAADHRCELIIMSSHAHTGPARAFLGSVTDAVVRSAKCPVLVMRRDVAAENVEQQSEPSTTTTRST
jgi:nucleotide-binding universal stress UspA family protein